MRKLKKMTAEEQALAEIRKARLTKFIDQVSKMSEDELNELKESIDIVTCEGHPLSPRNCVLLDLQGQGAGITISVVGGFQQWLDKGRAVRKGEKAFSILAPSQGKAKDKEGNIKLADDGTEIKKTYFKFVSVFDISQTDVVTQESEVEEVDLILV